MPNYHACGATCAGFTQLFLMLFRKEVLTVRLSPKRGPKANAIKINAGIHTGNLMAGVIKEAIPRYSIIGQAFFKAKQVQKRASGEKMSPNLCTLEEFPKS